MAEGNMMKLKDYLREKRLDPVEFAVICKLSVASVYRYLRGHKMHFKTAKKIEKITNNEVTVEELMGTYDSK